MRLLFLLIALFTIFSAFTPDSFKEKQLKQTRVREAYASKDKSVTKTLAAASINRDSLQLFFRAFKSEKVLEMWGKNVSDSAFVLLKEFPICEMSGNIGPKRRYKDLQVPEGFYYITALNPFSKYYLSLEINYPNASDSIRGVKGRLGNYIFIHGSCISSGCLAMTDDRIREIYIYCLEAMNGGQKRIGIMMYPARLTDEKFERLTTAYKKEKDKVTLWADLKKSYDLFNQNRIPPVVTYLPDGNHVIESGVVRGSSKAE